MIQLNLDWIITHRKHSFQQQSQTIYVQRSTYYCNLPFRSCITWVVPVSNVSICVYASVSTLYDGRIVKLNRCVQDQRQIQNEMKNPIPKAQGFPFYFFLFSLDCCHPNQIIEYRTQLSNAIIISSRSSNQKQLSSFFSGCLLLLLSLSSSSSY